MLVPQHMLL